MAEDEDRAEIERQVLDALERMSDKAAAAMAVLMDDMARKHPRVEKDNRNVIPMRRRETND